MATTVKTVLEQVNTALKGKIVYWMDNNETKYGQIIQIDKRGLVIVTRKGLPNQVEAQDDKVYVLDIDQVMLGILEVCSLN